MSDTRDADLQRASLTRKLTGIIDVHSHIILDLGTGRDAGTGIPIEMMPPWSVESTLSLMDTHGIAACVLSVPEAASSTESAKACEIARRTNESLAKIVAQHPTRFGAMATIPGRTMDGALQEMAYALDTLKFEGVATPTNIDDVYLGDARFDPWFEEMDRRGVTLFAHPTMTKASRPVDLGLHPSLLEFMFDTTRMLTNMVFSGAKKRFSQIKIISTHGGGTIPYLVTRLQTLEEVLGPGPDRTKLTAQEVKEGFASFYYDLTASTSSAQLHALLQLVPVSHLLMGLDHPFMPISSFAPAISDVERWEDFTDEDLSLLSHENAAFLYPGVAERIR